MFEALPKIKSTSFLKFISIITLFCLFASMFFVPIGKGVALPFYMVFLIIFVLYNLYMNYPEFKTNLKNLYNSASFKIFLLFFLWVFIGIIWNIAIGRFNSAFIVRAFIGGLVFSMLVPYVFSYCISFRLFTLKQLAQIIFILFLFIYVMGFLDFIGNSFHVVFIRKFLNIFVSRFMFDESFAGAVSGEANFSGVTRIASIFQEPASLAGFIALTAPIAYKLCFSNSKLFNNKFIDLYLKINLFGLLVFNLVGTQSPIFIIFGVFLLICALVKKYFSLKPINLIISLNLWCLFILVCFGLSHIDLNLNLYKTIFARVYVVIENLGNTNFLDLMLIDKSFAARFVTFANSFIIGLKNPIFGVGFGNLITEIIKQLQDSPIPLTEELTKRIILSSKGVSGLPSSILFRTMAETGIVGAIFLYAFFFRTLYLLNKKLKQYTTSLEKDLLIGFKYFLIILIFTSFYSSNLNLPVEWIFLGIIQSFILFKEKTRPDNAKSGIVNSA